MFLKCFYFKNLCFVFYEFMFDWEVDMKTFSITLDNDSVNNVMINAMKNQFILKNNFICNGEYFHVRCSVHVLNLIVQEGLEVIGSALKKIRDTIKYVRASEARKIEFKECVLQVRNIYTRVG